MVYSKRGREREQKSDMREKIILLNVYLTKKE